MVGFLKAFFLNELNAFKNSNFKNVSSWLIASLTASLCQCFRVKKPPHPEVATGV
jgi:hypothetical protein